MLLILLAFLGGALTIISPCILPVLPFVFARADQPFLKSGLPMLLGMALMFAVVATLAAVGGAWAVQANQYGRIIAIVLLGFFALTLLMPSFANRVMYPIVRLGNRVLDKANHGDPQSHPQTQQQSHQKSHSQFISSVLLGIATGLLWAPCAGPILGLVLTTAALNGANVHTSILLLSYALGAATSLAAALLIGGKVFAAMKRSIGAGEWIRRGLGVAVLAGVIAIAMGLDTGLLTKLSQTRTSTIEQKLLDQVQSNVSSVKDGNQAKSILSMNLPIEGMMPPLDGAVTWLNSKPLTKADLRGKVVLVDFWTYSCINCLRSLPYVKAWAAKYQSQGLVVIGVHAPEFAFEKNIGNVQKAVKDLGVNYPVAIDNNYAIWRAFNNQYWPAHYFIDAKGQIRHHHFGEGEYDQSERVIQQLLAEAGKTTSAGLVNAQATGIAQAADNNAVESPETYIGYSRAEAFAASPAIVPDRAQVYRLPTQLSLNNWGLDGNWRIENEKAVLLQKSGVLRYRFHARDLHLVMGPAPNGQPIRFKVRIDGAAPAADHGVDTLPDGSGRITEQRLYQLIRQKGDIREHSFEIEFLDQGAEVYAFTFG